jgi:hypothetical protein
MVISVHGLLLLSPYFLPIIDYRLQATDLLAPESASPTTPIKSSDWMTIQNTPEMANAAPLGWLITNDSTAFTNQPARPRRRARLPSESRRAHGLAPSSAHAPQIASFL